MGRWLGRKSPGAVFSDAKLVYGDDVIEVQRQIGNGFAFFDLMINDQRVDRVEHSYVTDLTRKPRLRGALRDDTGGTTKPIEVLIKPLTTKYVFEVDGRQFKRRARLIDDPIRHERSP